MSAMSKAQQKKGDEYAASAEKLLSKKSWFGGGQKNQEDAAELFLQAANAYKVGGLFSQAGEVYTRAATIYEKDNVSEAAKAYSQAGSCYKKSNPMDAVQVYQSAIALLTDVGRLTQAAKLCKECGELFENGNEEMGNQSGTNFIQSAIEMYDQAAELFSMEDSKSQSNTCRAKVAELASAAADPPDLLLAGQIYNQLGLDCLDSNLLKYNAKGYFLQSILCQLANGDGVGAEQSLSRYEGVDYTFSESREGRFARQLVECVEGYDAEAFSTACFEYDRISKLDPWKTSMLVKIKRSIQDGGDGDGDDDEDDVDLT